jgi:hypothetical protein
MLRRPLTVVVMVVGERGGYNGAAAPCNGFAGNGWLGDGCRGRVLSGSRAGTTGLVGAGWRAYFPFTGHAPIGTLQP